MTISRIRAFNVLIGLCDASTGLLLMCAPMFTLGLMQVSTLPLEPVYLRFIGAFVFSVGASYWLPQRIAGSEAEERTACRYIWSSTALIRSVVCCLVLLQVGLGALSAPWLSVAATDGIIAVVQLKLLSRLELADHE